MSFKENLIGHITEKKNSLCLGIDLHSSSAQPPFLRHLESLEGTIKAYAIWSHGLLELMAHQLPAVKFQSAFFEALGHEGWRLLEQLVAYAKNLGFLTILDAKRGDIASTMYAYGEMAFDQIKADALTVQPYLGYDSVSPLVPWLRKGKGIYLVWLTSNESGRFLQSLRTDQDLSVVELVLNTFFEKMKKDDVTDALGLVAGATRLTDLSPHLLERAAQFPLLIPGLGEQGGAFSKELKGLFKTEEANRYEMGAPHLIAMSRSLTGLGSSLENPLSTAKNIDEYFLRLKTSVQVEIEKYGSLVF